MTHNEAIKTIREVLLLTARELRTPSEPPQTYLEWLACKALAALESLAVEPREDAREFAQIMANHFNDSDNPYKKEWVAKAAALITARDERIRRECADRAVWYCEPFFPWGTKGSYANGLWASIMGGKE
jgi:hypothetical protein